MLVYQDITGYSNSVIDLEFNIDNTESGFKVAIGSGVNSANGLEYSGILFTGQSGYIFDQDGDFVGGYRHDVPFSIETHIHEDCHVSYYIDESLIKNNYTTLTHKPIRVEFEKIGQSSLEITNKGDSSCKLTY